MEQQVAWLPWKVDKLKELAEKGYTSNMLVKELKMSRAAIVGKASRMKIHLKGHDRRKVKPGSISKPARKRPRPHIPEVDPRIPNLDFKAFESKDEKIELVELIELVEHHCRWPIDGKFCGQKKSGKSSYCEHHRIISVRHPSN